jgi:hypothetical protein
VSHFLEILLQLLGCVPGHGNSFPKGSEMGRMGNIFGWFCSAFLILLTLGVLARAFLF